MIVLPGETFERACAEPGEWELDVFEQDEGDVFLCELRSSLRKGSPSRGLIRSSSALGAKDAPANARVVIEVSLPTAPMEGGAAYHVLGWVRKDEVYEPQEVTVTPLARDLFSRTRGIYETDSLANSTVLVIGLGSGGSFIAMELAKAGVGNFLLVDHDRLELENIVRHTCGISDLGRYKTKALRDQILDKNPFAKVETYELRIHSGSLALLQELIGRASLVFCCTDNRESRLLVNRFSIMENRVCIYGGTFRRAYGGHVLRVVPQVTACYQCFIDLLPEASVDQEISSDADASRIAYSDRPIAIEPGLSSDIIPISLMCVKLGIVELLKDSETTLANLREDLSASWFQWLNRREEGTTYSKLAPLDTDPEALRILAWYGIEISRNPSCPACGDFGLALGMQQLDPDILKAFEGEEIVPPANLP